MAKEDLAAETQRAANEFRVSRNTARPRAPWCRAYRHEVARGLALLGILILPASHFLAQDQPIPAVQRQKPADTTPKTRPAEDRILEQLIADIAVSTRALQIAENPSERISKPPTVTPGAPPLLSFRYFDGKQRHRFGNLDLVMDDAGH